MTMQNETEDQNGEKEVQVEIQDVVEKIMNEIDHVMAITVHHTVTHENIIRVNLSVFTSNVDHSGDCLGLFSSAHKIIIERKNERITIPFSTYGVMSGPCPQNSKYQTTIHMSENVIGTKPLALDDGLAYLRNKLENPEQWSREYGDPLDNVRNYSN